MLGEFFFAPVILSDSEGTHQIDTSSNVMEESLYYVTVILSDSEESHQVDLLS